MATYILLNGTTVTNIVAWDGVATFDTGSLSVYRLPANPPIVRIGDSYNTATDVVTPRADTLPETHAINAGALIAKSAAAIASNNAFIALASPTTAQAVAQVKVLCKELNALLRIAGSLLDDISDT
jgi:hypothetical protein